MWVWTFEQSRIRIFPSFFLLLLVFFGHSTGSQVESFTPVELDTTIGEPHPLPALATFFWDLFVGGKGSSPRSPSALLSPFWGEGPLKTRQKKRVGTNLF